MKKLFCAFALAAACITASAQGYDPVILLAGGTANITAGSTSNYTAAVNVRRADYVGVQLAFKLSGAGTENIIFKFSKSANGTYETTPSVLLTNAANGTTVVNAFHPVDVTGVRDLKLASIVNGSSGEYITNLTVTVGVKIPGR